MTQLEALICLRDNVANGVKYETMGHTRLCQRAFPKPADFDGSREAYRNSAAQRAMLVWRNGSLDEAKALHEAVFHEAVTRQATWSTRYGGNVALYHQEKMWVGKNDENEALAWFLAILEALIAKEEAAQ